MQTFEALEYSQQTIPLSVESEHSPLAHSDPLFDLENVRLPFVAEDFPAYPISNDEAATYYDQLRARQDTNEYREATNRTALLVGEGSLMAALPYILEDTIVLVDKDPAMVAFMQKYIEALRTQPNITSWLNAMGIYADSKISLELKHVFHRLNAQEQEWHDYGYPHPLTDEVAYTTAHELAKAKAIVPWLADITCVNDMTRLGDTLKAHEANVTLLNLTNLMSCVNPLMTSEEYADRLDWLPIVTNAPIMTTSDTRKLTEHKYTNDYIVVATGPFFGVENLRQQGGLLVGYDAFGSARDRQYIHNQVVVRPEFDDVMMTLLSKLVELQSNGFAKPHMKLRDRVSRLFKLTIYR